MTFYVSAHRSGASKLRDVNWHVSGTPLRTNQRQFFYRVIVIYRLTMILRPWIKAVIGFNRLMEEGAKADAWYFDHVTYETM